MADTKDATAEKADNKSGRRASFVRALHVPNIARRVKQFEQAVQADQSQTPVANRPKAADQAPAEKTISPKLSTPSVITRETSPKDDDIGGAEIPNIPLRRSSNTINTDFTDSSLGTWQRILAAGDLQNGQHPGPQSFNPFQLAAEQRYDAEYTAIDDMALYPVTECSWESSLPSVSEKSPAPSLRRETPSPPNIEVLDTPTFPPRRDTSLAIERTVELPASPVNPRPASPFDRETAPSRLTKSRSTSVTTATSFQTDDQTSAGLPALQVIGVDNPDKFHPVNEDDVDPDSFDLVIPSSTASVYSLEHRSELLFSVEHMRIIIQDPIMLHRFSTFLGAFRPQSVPLLNYLLEALKAIRAMEYMNDIISKSLRLDSHQLGQHPSDFATKDNPELTVNESLKQKTAAAFEALAKEDLPAYITHVWTDIVEISMRQKTMGMMPQNLRYLSEGLAEVFCITDPSRKDNPIVFASEEFHRTTQYGADYVMGRNCRFLQGPMTNPFSIQRIREKLAQGKEHHETFLNYRRDGLPFMNLLMCTPLLDSKGQVRYFLGAQIDVSGLAKDCSGLESLRKLVDQDEERQRQRQQGPNSAINTPTRRDSGADLDDLSASAVGTATTTSSARDPARSPEKNNDFRLLAEMLNRAELETVRRFGGRMHRSQQEQGRHLEAIGAWHKPRVILHDQYSPPSSPPQGLGSGRGYEISDANGNININMSSPKLLDSRPSSPSLSAVGKPPAIFENYLVVRPYPSLRILFASPTLRVPGILQSHFMSRIGGSRRIHEQLEHAFAEGHCVTATVKWVSGGINSSLRNVASTGTIPDNTSDVSGSTGSTGTVVGGNGHEAIGQEGRKRWIHCTPLLGANGHVGVWIVVIVDDDDGEVSDSKRRRKKVTRHIAPPVAPPVGFGRGSPLGYDETRHADHQTMNRLSEEEDSMRQHPSNGYEDTRRREVAQKPSVANVEREWEKAWEDVRLEKLQDTQRSEMRAKSPGNGGLDIGKLPVAAGGSDASTTPRSNGRPGGAGDANSSSSTAGNGDGTSNSNGNGNSNGTHLRNAKKKADMTGPIERAMGSISNVRNNLRSKSSADPSRQEESKKHDQQQQQQHQQKRPVNEPPAITAARKLGYID